MPWSMKTRRPIVAPGMDLDAGEEARRCARRSAPSQCKPWRPAPVRAAGAARARAGPGSRSAPPTSSARPGRARGCRRCLRAGARTWSSVMSYGPRSVSALDLAPAGGFSAASRHGLARCRAGCGPPRGVSCARLNSWLQPRHQLLRRLPDRGSRSPPAPAASASSSRCTAARVGQRRRRGARRAPRSRRAPGASRRRSAAPPAPRLSEP